MLLVRKSICNKGYLLFAFRCKVKNLLYSDTLNVIVSLFPALLMEGGTSSAQYFMFSLFVARHCERKIRTLQTCSRLNKVKCA